MLITGKTRVLCVIGYPIQHSLSPVIHNAGFEAHGLDFVYVPFAIHPDNVEAGLKGLQALGVMGMTVTVPLKELVLPFLDHIDESARHTGAVNMVLFKNGRKLKRSPEYRVSCLYIGESSFFKEKCRCALWK